MNKQQISLRNKMFRLAENKGWKKWGSFTKKDGSSYQCFRMKNRYLWIGWRYIQNTNYGHALDYALAPENEIMKFLEY